MAAGTGEPDPVAPADPPPERAGTRLGVNGCPGVAQIERLAAGEQVAPDIESHIGDCPACQLRLDSALRDSEFLGRARRLAGDLAQPDGSPRLAGYRIIGIVSSGAQGVVYRGVQESTSRPVAVKTLSTGAGASARQRIRAEREAEIAARLRHPNIVTIFESRTLHDRRIAVVMEFVDGVPLDQWTPPGTTPAQRQQEQLRMFLAVCGAIHHAHLNGVIHRDLKPDNILVTPDGRPVVLDFGIAKAEGLHTTRTGEFAGTPAYASPEQAAGKPDDVDALTDVYSLGVILYRLLCGAMPYQLDGSIFEIARTIGTVEPLPPRQIDPSIAADLEAIILRAIRKDKHQRYQSAAGLARDIERYLAGSPVEARSTSGWYLLRKAIAVNRGRLGLSAAALALLIVAGSIVALSLSRAAAASRREAMQQQQTRAESARARAVTELLRAAMPNADPSRPDLAIAVGAGLSRLYLRLEAGAFADDPETDQTLRRMWGEVYTGLGTGKATQMVEYSEVSLRNGLVRMRMQHGAEHPDIAASLHDLAGVLVVRKRLPEAEATCREALAMREKLRGPNSLEAADSRALLARVLLALGRPADAEAEANAALAVLHRLPERDADLRIASMTSLKSRVLLQRNEPAAAEPLVRETMRRRLRHLAPEDPDLLAGLNDAADLTEAFPTGQFVAVLRTVWNTGDASPAPAIRADLPLLVAPDRGSLGKAVLTGRTDALERLIRLQEILIGPEDLAVVGTLLARFRAAEGESREQQRYESLLRAADILSRRTTGDEFPILLCIEQAATILAFEGQSERAVEYGTRACQIWERIPAPARDHLLAGNTRRRLGWYLAVAGRWQDGAREYERAIGELSAAVGPNHHTVAQGKGGLAYCLLALGQPERADELSAAALALALASPISPPDQISHIRFVRAHVLAARARDLAAQNRLDEARSLFAEVIALADQTWDVFYKLVGIGYTWRRELIHDAAEACDFLGDPAAASAWRDRLHTPPLPAS